MSDLLTVVFLTGLLSACIRLTVPILFTALGECISQRSGILNIGLEGYMIVGALFGFLGAFYGNIFTGILAAAFMGAIFGALVGLLTITMRADQVVTGITLNIFAYGLTAFIFRTAFSSQLKAPTTNPIPALSIPFLSKIPIIGPALFSQSLFVYIGFLMVPVVWFALFKTPLGLKVRAVGEKPEAVDSAGLSVLGLRYLSVIFCGAMSGVGGAFLSLGSINFFVENITAGRGFIALASVIFGAYHPVRILGACLFFGLADAFQLRMQALRFGVPHEILLVLPYFLTLVVLFSVAGRTRPPSAICVPFVKESK